MKTTKDDRFYTLDESAVILADMCYKIIDKVTHEIENNMFTIVLKLSFTIKKQTVNTFYNDKYIYVYTYNDPETCIGHPIVYNQNVLHFAPGLKTATYNLETAFSNVLKDMSAIFEVTLYDYFINDDDVDYTETIFKSPSQTRNQLLIDISSIVSPSSDAFYERILTTNTLHINHQLESFVQTNADRFPVVDKDMLFEIIDCIEKNHFYNKHAKAVDFYVIRLPNKSIGFVLVFYCKNKMKAIVKYYDVIYREVSKNMVVPILPIYVNGLYDEQTATLVSHALESIHTTVIFRSFDMKSVETFHIEFAVNHLRILQQNSMIKVLDHDMHEIMRKVWIFEMDNVSNSSVHTYTIRFSTGSVCLLHLLLGDTNKTLEDKYHKFHETIALTTPYIQIPYKFITIAISIASIHDDEENYKLQANVISTHIIRVVNASIIQLLYKNKIFTRTSESEVDKIIDAMSKETHRNKYTKDNKALLSSLKIDIEGFDELYLLQCGNSVRFFNLIKEGNRSNDEYDFCYNVFLQSVYRDIPVHRLHASLWEEEHLYTYLSERLENNRVETLIDFSKIHERPIDRLQHTNRSTGTIYELRKYIRYAYVRSSGSKELNVSLIYYFVQKERIEYDLLERAIMIMNEHMKYMTDPNLLMYDKDVYVYHGTSQQIHEHNLFVCYTFVSTTRLLNTALSYAGKTGVIYVLRIPKRFPFINFVDNFHQIILPIGTHVMVDRVVTRRITYVFCRVQPYQRKIGELILDVLQNNCYSKTGKTLETKEIVEDEDNPYRAIVSEKIKGKCSLTRYSMNDGSSVFYTAQINDKPYIFKDIVKGSDRIRANRNDNQVFMRILNEITASKIYSEVYGLHTFNYKIYQTDPDCLNSKMSRFMIASEMLDITYIDELYEDESDEEFVDSWNRVMLDGFIADCIMGNWDVLNNNNWGMCDDIIIRTDVGGCLMFRGRGDRKIQFSKHVTPDDHIAIASQSKFLLLVQKMSVDTCRNCLTNGYDDLVMTNDIEPKLKEVANDIRNLVINMFISKEHREIYHKMLNNICTVLISRHNYYKSNKEKVINEVLHVCGKQYISRSQQASSHSSGGSSSSDIQSKSKPLSPSHPKSSLKPLSPSSSSLKPSLKPLSPSSSSLKPKPKPLSPSSLKPLQQIQPVRKDFTNMNVHTNSVKAFKDDLISMLSCNVLPKESK
jgi:hypothetical protein